MESEIDMSSEIEKDNVAYERMSDKEKQVLHEIESMRKMVERGDCTGMVEYDLASSYAMRRNSTKRKQESLESDIAQIRARIAHEHVNLQDAKDKLKATKLPTKEEFALEWADRIATSRRVCEALKINFTVKSRESMTAQEEGARPSQA